MAISAPAPMNHNASCQAATQDGCDCKCNGMMHQRDILVAAIQSRGTLSHYEGELTKLFGSAFTLLSTAPVPPERVRRSDGWDPSARTGKAKSQVEQRIVDVSLRDILRNIHQIAPAKKVGWMDFLDGLTVKTKWESTAAAIRRATGSHDNQSGYFWASMLAATSGVAAGPSALSSTGIQAFPASSTTKFDEVRYPRGASGSSVRVINEMRSRAAVGIAANEIDAAWAGGPLKLNEKALLTAVIGSAVCADLWRHPAAVRYLLVAAIKSLRTFSPAATFSLDQSGTPVEQAIDDKLGDEWAVRGAW